jgi:outer membrane receptor protein involved in Fe transport
MDAAIALLEPVSFEEFKTERINTFEIGYKSLIANRLYFDAYYYYSSYKDFIAEIDFTQAVPNGITNPNPNDPNSDASKQAIIERTTPTQRYGFDINADGNVNSQGWAAGLEYTLPQGYKLGGNVAYNELIDQDDLIRQGFRASYNTPKWRYVLNVGNPEVVDNLGFNLIWRWQDAFLWESSFGNGIVPPYSTLDAQVSYKIPSLKSIVKIGGSNVLNERYTTSIGNPRIGAIYYISITFDEFLN